MNIEASSAFLASSLHAPQPALLEDYGIAARLGVEIKDIRSNDFADLYDAYGDYVKELAETPAITKDLMNKRDALYCQVAHIRSRSLEKCRFNLKDSAVYFSRLAKKRIKALGILRAIETNHLDLLRERLKDVLPNQDTRPQYLLYAFSSEILRNLLAMGLVKEVSQHTPNCHRDVDFQDNVHFYLPEQEHLPLLFRLRAALPESCQFDGARQWHQKFLTESLSQFEVRALVQNGVGERLTAAQFNELKSVADDIHELGSIIAELNRDIEEIVVRDCSTRTLLLTKMITLKRLEIQMESLQIHRRHRRSFTQLNDGSYFRISDTGLDELIEAI